MKTEKEHLGVRKAEGLALYLSRSYCDALGFAVADTPRYDEAINHSSALPGADRESSPTNRAMTSFDG